MRVLVTRPLPGDPARLVRAALLRFGGAEADAIQVEIGESDERLPHAELLRRIRGVTGLLSTPRDLVGPDVLDAAGPSLRVVSNYATGTDNIDRAACAARGVRVGNTPDAVVEPTADIAWLLILAAARRAGEGERLIRSGGWQGVSPTLLNGQRLLGKTLLIVGAGRIGLATARRALGWRMSLLYCARTRHPEFEVAPFAAERVELDAGLARADVVSLHTPLTPQTRGLIDARRIALMKPGAILVNTARGAVVDETALVEALGAGRLHGAGLDVFEREPEVHPGLLSLPNVFMLPHLGSSTQEDRVWMTEQAVENLVAGAIGAAMPNEVAGA